jgi:hypothetical protein
MQANFPDINKNCFKSMTYKKTRAFHKARDETETVEKYVTWAQIDHVRAA